MIIIYNIIYIERHLKVNQYIIYMEAVRMSLYDLNLNGKGKVKNITGDERLAKRLSALGFTEGTEIKVKNFAPFGDPILVSVRGYDIAIRRNDAKNIFLREA